MGGGGGRGQKKFTQCGGSLQTKVMCKKGLFATKNMEGLFATKNMEGLFATKNMEGLFATKNMEMSATKL